MQGAVNEFGIRFLLHFTKASNLANIFSNGILSINELQSNGIFYSWNDCYRYDGCHNASSLSIEYPNYKMFYKYRSLNHTTDWVVLAIRKEVLWEKDCAFCVENAASNSVTQIPIELRKGPQAFRRLYDEIPDKPTRQILRLHPATPTNPQAEVLVFGHIEPTYIFSVCFENTETCERYKQLIPNNVNIEIQKWLYEPRPDYEFWKNN